MTLQIPDGFAHVVFQLALVSDPEPMATTVGVELVSGAIDLQAVADGIATAFKNEVLEIIPPAYSLKSTDVFAGVNGPGNNDTVLATSLIAGPGEHGVTPLPQNCAILIHKRTALAGRRGRGRMYLPGASEGETSATGVINPATVNDYNSKMAQFRTAVIALPDVIGLVLLHTDGGVSPAGAPTPITAFQADNVIATQRRRLR